MSIYHLKRAAELKKAGEYLGRAGMSERVIKAVRDFMEEGQTYRGAMVLAGRLKAIAQMANSDAYWQEQVDKGFHRELALSPKED